MKKYYCMMVLLALLFLSDNAISALVAQWKFDDNGGATALDSAGNNHGTVHGAEWLSSPYNGALSFNGNDDYVEVPNSDILVGSNQFTIEAWVNISSIGGQDYPQHYVVDSRDGIGGGFGMNVDTDKIQIWVGDWYPDLPSTIQVGQWHHVVGIFTGTEVLAYVDGQEMGRVDYTGNIVPSTAPLHIGQRYTSSERFHGLMGEVRIYNEVIPEPTTLTLLTIGGLLIGRRK